MHESLYDRFRPFKPYDLALALVMVVLIAASTDASLTQQALMLALGMIVFLLLDLVQRRIPVPTPAWQGLLIVTANTLVVTVLVYFADTSHLKLALYMLNVAFATVAFGERLGLTTACLSIAGFLYLTGASMDLTECGLVLVVLVTLVAMLVRVNRLQRDALVDAVTGLRNHRYFQVRLREELVRSERSSRSIALIMLDLDNFKHINDGRGHAAGDLVLRRVAGELVNKARAADIVCRYGGDEFVLILPDATMDDALVVAERLRQAVETQLASSGPLTISAGLASYPEHGGQADALITAADAAMYEAKKAGKNRVVSASVLSRISRDLPPTSVFN